MINHHLSTPSHDDSATLHSERVLGLIPFRIAQHKLGSQESFCPDIYRELVSYHSRNPARKNVIHRIIIGLLSGEAKISSSCCVIRSVI